MPSRGVDRDQPGHPSFPGSSVTTFASIRSIPTIRKPTRIPITGLVLIKNRPPGTQAEFPAAQVVDGGFLELVRYGIRKADDPLIEASVKVIDAVLRHDFPQGPCFRRYSHDGYGQQDDGGAFTSYGRGRPWPLLTGERGHYELAAGHDVQVYIRAMEGFANPTRLLPEQIWDQPDIPSQLLFYGRQTGVGDAADVGARRVHQAVCARSRTARSSTSFRKSRRATSAGDRAPNRVVEAQSTAEVGARRKPAAHPGAAIHSSSIGRATNGVRSSKPPRR